MGPPPPGRVSGILIVLWSITEKIKIHEQAKNQPVLGSEIVRSTRIDKVRTCCLPTPFLHSEGISPARNSHVRNLKKIPTQ